MNGDFPHSDDLTFAWVYGRTESIFIEADRYDYRTLRGIANWWRETKPAPRKCISAPGTFRHTFRNVPSLNVIKNSAMVRAAQAGAHPYKAETIEGKWFTETWSPADKAVEDIVTYGDNGSFTIFLSIGA